MIYENWTLIPWDGNPDLSYKCWRKTFNTPRQRGHVSVGVGEFDSIVYSYGANSSNSISSTRWRETGNITEEQAMQIVDRNKGVYNHKDNEPTS